MANILRSVPKLNIHNSALFLCDMQTKFQPTVKYFNEIVSVSNRLLRAAMTLQMPTIVTEQYPKGLGPTVASLGIEEFGLKPIAKTQFCMMVPQVETELRSKPNVNSVILCGIEAHACIQQTALELLAKQYQVHVIVDACSSRSLVDRKYAFKLMRDCGAYLTTSESVILSLLRDASHPKFKEVQQLIQNSAPDSELK
ncbi:Isochorismatase domain-containing protein 2, mitochondrial [Chamberlinius hualienensis]